MQSLDQAVIEDLFPYTEYEARIVPFNSKGEANSTGVISVRTKEAGKFFYPPPYLYFVYDYENYRIMDYYGYFSSEDRDCNYCSHLQNAVEPAKPVR